MVLYVETLFKKAMMWLLNQLTKLRSENTFARQLTSSELVKLNQCVLKLRMAVSSFVPE
jgi:hypothetical protein